MFIKANEVENRTVANLRCSRFILLLSIVFFLHGCASPTDNAYWPVNHVDKLQIPSKYEADKYAKEGHFNTTELVAKMAGLSNKEAARLAFFSQAPDDMWFKYSAPSVGVWGFVPPFWSYRFEIMDTLHALHGGNNEAVIDRRQKLKNLIISYRSRKESDWKVGFLIHAMGDSYGHVYGETTNLRAYGGIVGHAFDNGEGENRPDMIVTNNNYLIYCDYVRALFDALTSNNKGGDREALNQFISAVKVKITDEKISNENFIKFVQLYTYSPKNLSSNDEWTGQWWPNKSANLTDNDKTSKMKNEIHFSEVSKLLSKIRKEL